MLGRASVDLVKRIGYIISTKVNGWQSNNLDLVEGYRYGNERAYEIGHSRLDLSRVLRKDLINLSKAENSFCFGIKLLVHCGSIKLVSLLQGSENCFHLFRFPYCKAVKIVFIYLVTLLNWKLQNCQTHILLECCSLCSNYTHLL